MRPSSFPETWTIRSATMDDLERAVDMFNARSRAFHGQDQSTVETMRGWWESPRFEVERDTQIVLDDRNRLIGWAHVGEPGEPYVSLGCGVITHPDVADRDDLWDFLFAWSLEHASRLIPRAPEGAKVIISESALDEDGARKAGAERAGFEMVRVQNTMRIDLETQPPAPVWPEGILVRPVDVEAEVEGLAVASREAFRDHWGYVESPLEQSIEDWRQWIASLGETRDPSLWFVACDGDEIAGVGLFSAEIAGDKTRSYVESLSVRPAYRKRGIALALLRHGFREVYKRGYEAVELDMDSENLTGALRLYERAGMHVIRQTLTYEKVLREGEDLITRELDA